MTNLTATRLFALGWVFAACGGFMTALMAFVIWATAHSEFTGTARDAAFEFWMFSLVTTVGLFFLAAGLWLIKRRKTNKVIFYGGIGILGLLIVTIMMSLPLSS